MLRRFYLFGIGIILGVFMLSFGPENRLKKTFYSYIDYFNINKRIIYHFLLLFMFIPKKNELIMRKSKLIEVKKNIYDKNDPIILPLCISVIIL